MLGATKPTSGFYGVPLANHVVRVALGQSQEAQWPVPLWAEGWSK
jgi:hypothetical protein